MRTVSDDLCRQYGLSVIEEKAYQSKTRQQYYHEKSLESLMKKDIDEAIKVSMTRTNVFYQLQFEGYEIKQIDNEIALKHHAHEQWIALSSLGKAYSLASIDKKILNQQLPTANKTIYSKKEFDIQPYCQKYQRKELNGLQRLYIHYQFKLGILPILKNTKPKYSKELKKAIKEMENLSNETIILCKNNIETFEQLKQYQEPLQEQYNDLISKRQLCRNKIRRCPEGALKEQLKAEAKSYTPEIKKLRKEIQHCERIKERSLKMQQFELETQARVEKGRTRS